MLHATEVRGELARIQPPRDCDRRAELLGLLIDTDDGELRTLDHAVARTAVYLAASLGLAVDAPRSVAADRVSAGGRHHVAVRIERDSLGQWSWDRAAACDRRAFLRGVLLGAGSMSFGRSGPHVEIVLGRAAAAKDVQAALVGLGVRALRSERRGRQVVYLKGHEEIAALLRLVGANRGVLELETHRVGREVQSRLNRLVNAEEANLSRTVRAADRQLAAIAKLEASGRLPTLGQALRDAAAIRRRLPEGDLGTLAAALDISRSAMNHRLRRIIELAEEDS